LRELTRFIWWMQTHRQIAANLRPSQLTWAVSPPVAATVHIHYRHLLLLLSESWCSFYHPAESGRLSRCVITRHQLTNALQMTDWVKLLRHTQQNRSSRRCSSQPISLQYQKTKPNITKAHIHKKHKYAPSIHNKHQKTKARFGRLLVSLLHYIILIQPQSPHGALCKWNSAGYTHYSFLLHFSQEKCLG